MSAVLINYIEEHSEAETKSSVTLIKPCGHHDWLPVYICILLNFTGSVILAQLFCLIRHEEWRKAKS